MFLALVIICGSDLVETCLTVAQHGQIHLTLEACHMSVSQAVQRVEEHGFVAMSHCVPIEIGEVL